MMNKAPENLGQDRISLMVIEDNDYMLDILANSLKRIGFTRLQRAKNGKEAVEYLKLTSKGFSSTGTGTDARNAATSGAVVSPVEKMNFSASGGAASSTRW